jgi:predicted dehydrogenase
VILTSIHEIDYAYSLFGPVEAVTCVARTQELDVDVEDTAFIVLEHAGGALSEITLDFVQRVYRRSLQVTGTGGTIEWALLDDRARIYSASDEAWSDLIHYPDYDINRCYLDELTHFSRVVARETDPLVGLQDGIHVLTVGLAAKESARLGRRLTLSQFAPQTPGDQGD